MATSTTLPVDLQGLVEGGTDLVDLTDVSLAALRTSSTSVLSHAVRRAVRDAGTGSEFSAGFNNRF
jgi:FXSXX-COOH protein